MKRAGQEGEMSVELVGSADFTHSVSLALQLQYSGCLSMPATRTNPDICPEAT